MGSTRRAVRAVDPRLVGGGDRGRIAAEAGDWLPRLTRDERYDLLFR